MPRRRPALDELPIRRVIIHFGAKAYADRVQGEREAVERTTQPATRRLDVSLLQGPDAHECICPLRLRGGTQQLYLGRSEEPSGNVDAVADPVAGLHIEPKVTLDRDGAGN